MIKNLYISSSMMILEMSLEVLVQKISCIEEKFCRDKQCSSANSVESIPSLEIVHCC